MAVELQAKEHLWANPVEEDTLTLHYFVHNPLHDVESVIWMAIYFALRRCSRRVFASREWVGSGTMPKMAMRTAPPAMSSVPKSIHIEKTSPRSIRAKKAFHSSETAPSGARMTTGREAI